MDHCLVIFMARFLADLQAAVFNGPQNTESRADNAMKITGHRIVMLAIALVNLQMGSAIGAFDDVLWLVISVEVLVEHCFDLRSKITKRPPYDYRSVAK